MERRGKGKRRGEEKETDEARRASWEDGMDEMGYEFRRDELKRQPVGVFLGPSRQAVFGSAQSDLAPMQGSVDWRFPLLSAVPLASFALLHHQTASLGAGVGGRLGCA